MEIEPLFLKRIPSKLCDIATVEYESKEPHDAAMNPDTNTVLDHQLRNTTVYFGEAWDWFGAVLYSSGLEGNVKNQWDFYINSHEAVQFAVYNENQHYGWHVDTFLLSGQPLDRKVTVICLMNDPSEFEGGELQLQFHGKTYTPQLRKGSIIAFPSYILHQVTPVTKGVRKSAVLWLSGPAFK
jgi:PKHD-type hydroxylase